MSGEGSKSSNVEGDQKKKDRKKRRHDAPEPHIPLSSSSSTPQQRRVIKRYKSHADLSSSEASTSRPAMDPPVVRRTNRSVSTGHISEPRQRTAIACQYCRRRKVSA
jgi:hypothetical protein